jgi:hypothetical protein
VDEQVVTEALPQKSEIIVGSVSRGSGSDLATRSLPI